MNQAQTEVGRAETESYQAWPVLSVDAKDLARDLRPSF